MIYTSFLSSTALDGLELIRVDGESPHERYEALHDLITREAGASTAALLAQPEISYGNGEAPTIVSWYTGYEGEATPITRLDPARRGAAEAMLKARIDALTAIMARSELGPLLAAAFYVPSPADVYVIGREPVITNWGLAASDLGTSDSRRNAAFAAGLGALGLGMAAPPLSAGAFGAWRDQMGLAGAGSAFAAGAAAPPPPSDPPAPSADAADDSDPAPGVGTAPVATAVAAEDRPEGPFYRRAWFPALVAVLLAAIILIILLVPGVLLYPERDRIALIEQQTDVLEDSNEALEERLAQLRQARENGVCTADGDFSLTPPPGPGGVAPDPANPGTAPQAPGTQDPATQDPGAAGMDQSMAPLVPPPLDTLVPSDNAQGGGGSLLDRLDAGVVLVIGPTGDGASIGTGFFVNDSTVITNSHVINEADPDRIVVINRALGRAVPVRIAAQTQVNAPGDLDFAALTGDFGSPQALTVTPQVSRLDQVVAAGFPVLITGENQLFQDLMQSGGATEAPMPSTTRGVVTSIYQSLRGVSVIAHDADISQGNSGGPLVDLCGRVVGVNTFTTLDPETNARALYSITTAELLTFAQANGITLNTGAGACQPQVAPPGGAGQAGDPAGDQPAADPGADPAAPADPDDAGLIPRAPARFAAATMAPRTRAAAE